MWYLIRRQEACAPNLGREIPEDDDKKNSKSKEGSGEGGVEAPAGAEAPPTAKSKKNKKVVFKVQPGSWVADANCWVPSCVTWGQQVAELYGHTEVIAGSKTGVHLYNVQFHYILC